MGSFKLRFQSMLDDIGQFLWNAVPSLANKFTSAGLTGAEREANAFSAAEAQKARDFSEEMYLQYQSPKAMMAQYKDAGLNPALMYGSAPSPSMPAASSAASSVSPGVGGDLVGFIMTALTAKAQIKSAEADAKLKTSEANWYDAQQQAQYDKTLAETKNILANVELTQVKKDEAVEQIKKIHQDISESEARAALLTSERLFKDKEVEWYDALQRVSVAESEARTERERQAVSNMKQEILESKSRILVNEANKNLIDKETLKAAEEIGILQYDKQIGAYKVAHMDGDRVWGRLETAGKVIGSVVGIGIGAATASSTIAKNRAATAVAGVRPSGLKMYDNFGNSL